jgi:glycosyltransferase involved in cell wall biosynthesis
MANILINGYLSRTGGGRSILHNYLSMLKAASTTHKFYALTPNYFEYASYAGAAVEILKVDPKFGGKFYFPFLYGNLFPRTIDRLKIDLVFNFGDLVIPTETSQIYYFDWPYAAYPTSAAWKRMDWPGYLERRAKLILFKRWLHHAKIVIAQSETMKNRLEQYYGLKNVRVIPNAVSLENVDGASSRDYKLPIDRLKLLYLTHYYSHKNLELFLPLARLIKERQLSYTLVTTVAANQHPRAAEFLATIANEGLTDVISNIGPVEKDDVPSLYRQCDALLMPTLLESYSGAYAEAMFHQLTIFTSRLDFAEDVCEKAAYYFDPLDVNSVLNTIESATADPEERRRKALYGRARIDSMATWPQVFEGCQALIDLALAHPSKAKHEN